MKKTWTEKKIQELVDLKAAIGMQIETIDALQDGQVSEYGEGAAEMLIFKRENRMIAKCEDAQLALDDAIEALRRVASLERWIAEDEEEARR